MILFIIIVCYYSYMHNRCYRSHNTGEIMQVPNYCMYNYGGVCPLLIERVVCKKYIPKPVNTSIDDLRCYCIIISFGYVMLVGIRKIFIK